MEHLLRTLITLRGLVLAGTLVLTITGGYLERGTADSVGGVHPMPSLEVHVAAAVRATLPQNLGILRCKSISTAPVVFAACK